MTDSVRLAGAVVLGLCLLNACDDPLKRAQDLDEPRVLGATVHVVGDETRAEPSTLETVAVEFVAGSPDPFQGFGWAFEVCWATATSFGAGECETEPFTSFTSDDTTASPRAQLSFRVPPHPNQTAQPSTLLIRGAFCPNSGVSLLDFPQGIGCRDTTSAPLPAELRVITNPVTPNHNPKIEIVHFDDTEWPALLTKTPSECAASAGPRVRAGSGQHTLTLLFADTAREALSTSTTRQPTRESLLISHFSTLGKLARRYSALTPDEPNRAISVLWEAPATVENDTPVSFFVFVRDLRGGADFVELSLCLEPSAP
ncbi:MAG: hypothetical protein SFV15_02430 [Polyangiaceae bacterium]|nr:hypothetical protein [Polyangiaceae bacterium]